jgi:hypothetical protein
MFPNSTIFSGACWLVPGRHSQNVVAEARFELPAARTKERGILAWLGFLPAMNQL